MIYATERDAKLARMIGPEAMWRKSGATSVCHVTAIAVDVGTALTTVTICFEKPAQYRGTAINAAIPLPFKLGSDSHQSEPSLMTPSKMVEELRETFGLNVTQLAQALHIERITVYAWMRTELLEKLNQSNRNRLWSLHKLAQQWRQYSPLSGKYLLEPIPGQDTTILQMLCQEDLSPYEFARAYELLAKATAPSTRVQQNQAERSTALKKGIENLRKNSNKFGMNLD